MLKRIFIIFEFQFIMYIYLRISYMYIHICKSEFEKSVLSKFLIHITNYETPKLIKFITDSKN